MRRIVPLLIITAILLGSCTPPKGNTPARPEPDRPTSTAATTPTGETTPTETRPPLPSATEEATPGHTPSTTTEHPPGPKLAALDSGKPVTITVIHMLDERSGWGIGHQPPGEGSDHILFTKDGGQTWEDRSPPEPAPIDPAETKTAWAYFIDESLAWVIYTPEGRPPPIGDQYVWYTQDGGRKWNLSSALPLLGLEAFFVPEGFTFINEEQGWLLVHVDAGMSHDYSYLFATKDGGSTWQRITDPYSFGLQSLHNSGLTFLDAQFGWVTKDNLGVMAGAFFEQTVDGGITWEDVFLPAPPEYDWFTEYSRCSVSAPAFTSEQSASLIVKCRLYGEDISPDEEWSLIYVYTTRDLGKTWKHTLLPSPVESLVFLNEQEGWAFGREHYKTTDGGLSWVQIKTVHWDGQFSFVDTLNGWAVARNADEIALVKTVDGGQTWQVIEPLME